jgi:hypothetical protein
MSGITEMDKAKGAEVLPVADARHQFYAEEISETKHGRALPLSVGAETVGLDVALIIKQAVEDLDCVPAPRSEPYFSGSDFRYSTRSRFSCSVSPRLKNML